MSTMDRRCKYASKPCYNIRSIKDNGEFHTLCGFHRDKANHAQRLWYTRKATDGVRASTDDIIVTKEEKPLKKQRQRKITDQANACVIITPVLPRKRGRVTFRNASVTSPVASLPMYNAMEPASPGTPHVHTNTIHQLYEPHQMPLPWESIVFPTSAFGEANEMISDWPMHTAVSSPNDPALMDMFDTAEGAFGYLESTDYCLRV